MKINKTGTIIFLGLILVSIAGAVIQQYGREWIITNGGYVGIGTLTPTQKLTVNGDMNISGISYFYDAPEIHDNYGQLSMYSTASGNNPRILMYNSTGSKVWEIRVSSDDFMQFRNVTNSIAIQIHQNGSLYARNFVDFTTTPEPSKSLTPSTKIIDQLREYKVVDGSCENGRCKIDKTSLPPECTLYDYNIGETGRDLTCYTSWQTVTMQEMMKEIDLLKARVKVLEEKQVLIKP